MTLTCICIQNDRPEKYKLCKNLYLKLHSMYWKKLSPFAFMLEIHGRVMSFSLQEAIVPKKTNPWENSRICPSNLFGGILFPLLKLQTKIRTSATG